MRDTHKEVRLRKRAKKQITILPVGIPDSTKTKTMKFCEKKLGEPIENYIARKLNEGYSYRQIVKLLPYNIDHSLLCYWVNRLGIVKGVNK